MPLAEIQRWPRNPKLHAETGIDESLEEFGFTEPLVLDERTKRLVAGHGRLEALQRRKLAKKLPPKNVYEKDGDWHVPVLRGVSFKDEAQAERYLLASNRLTELGGWDTQALQEMLKSLDTSTDSLLGSGFTTKDIAKEIAENTAQYHPKEIDLNDFSNFKHVCPRCQFEFD